MSKLKKLLCLVSFIIIIVIMSLLLIKFINNKIRCNNKEDVVITKVVDNIEIPKSYEELVYFVENYSVLSNKEEKNIIIEDKNNSIFVNLYDNTSFNIIYDITYNCILIDSSNDYIDKVIYIDLMDTYDDFKNEFNNSFKLDSSKDINIKLNKDNTISIS